MATLRWLELRSHECGRWADRTCRITYVWTINNTVRNAMQIRWRKWLGSTPFQGNCVWQYKFINKCLMLPLTVARQYIFLKSYWSKWWRKKPENTGLCDNYHCHYAIYGYHNNEISSVNLLNEWSMPRSSEMFLFPCIVSIVWILIIFIVHMWSVVYCIKKTVYDWLLMLVIRERWS
jgi:hypothetical protein